jgi:hypothetical protein
LIGLAVISFATGMRAPARQCVMVTLGVSLRLCRKPALTRQRARMTAELPKEERGPLHAGRILDNHRLNSFGMSQGHTKPTGPP